MNEPIVFKHSVVIGQLTLFQLLVPPLVAIAVLFGLTWAYGVQFDSEYRVLVVLVATSVALRWLLLLGILIGGFFDDRSASRLGLPDGTELLGGLRELAAYVNAHNIEVIFIALPMRQVQRVVDLIQSRTAEIQGVPIVAMCSSSAA